MRPPVAARQTSSTRDRLSVAEGAIVLVAVYALAGAGIGKAAGSALTGVIVGATVGLLAAAAVLLVSGASANSAAEARARASVTILDEQRSYRPPVVRQRYRTKVTTGIDR